MSQVVLVSRFLDSEVGFGCRIVWGVFFWVPQWPRHSADNRNSAKEEYVCAAPRYPTNHRRTTLQQSQWKKDGEFIRQPSDSSSKCSRFSPRSVLLQLLCRKVYNLREISPCYTLVSDLLLYLLSRLFLPNSSTTLLRRYVSWNEGTEWQKVETERHSFADH